MVSLSVPMFVLHEYDGRFLITDGDEFTGYLLSKATLTFRTLDIISDKEFHHAEKPKPPNLKGREHNHVTS